MSCYRFLQFLISLEKPRVSSPTLPRQKFSPSDATTLTLRTFCRTFLPKWDSYLGLPLHYKGLRKVHLQPLIDKIGRKLPRWIGKNIARPGRVTLAKTVLAATATFHQTVIPIPLWALRKVDKIARGFVWKGNDSEMASGGHSLINWDTVYRYAKS
jgi:hypothetical protein